MRTVSATIWNLWEQGGPYVGEDGAPHSRVTVEPDWFLNASFSAGNFNKVPVHWWQRADNSQVEVEIPNIKSIQTDRNVDQDAARATIVLNNQWHYNNGELDSLTELGQPGYFTFSRGESSDAQARWGHIPNDWAQIIVPNALIRTYQGYGGKDKTIDQAVADGNIMLSGVWLVDQVSLNTDGTVSLVCRDMAKLLIDQFLWPPLVPDAWYPITYCRFYFDKGTTPQVIYGDHAPAPYDRSNSLRYVASAGDELGQNTAQNGHFPLDALDQNGNTYWLSASRATPTEWVYYEVNVTEAINHSIWTPFQGNYQMYISIMENGQWVGSNTIPGPSGYNIAYVFQTGIANEGAGEWSMDRVYQAQNVRFTFTNLARFDTGGVNYRAGMRELSVGRIESSLPTKKIVGIAPVPGDAGYYMVGTDGGVFAMGRATFYGSSGGGGTDNPWSGIAIKPDADGYWTVRDDGRVFAFGSATNLGEPWPAVLAGPIRDIEPTASGLGYWLMGADGGVFAYGDATFYGSTTAPTFAEVVMSMAVRPQEDGYWLLRATGEVEIFGSAAHYGDGLTTTMVGLPTGIASTSSGAGYWVVTDTGHVYAFGDAQYLGGPNTAGTLNGEVTDIQRGTGGGAGGGYTIVAEDGGVFNYGTQFHGSIVSDFSWEVKKEGNYKDYADIIKDLLLWSGWWLYDGGAGASSPPEVFGNIETTGIFNNTGDGCLPEDMFQNRPVIDPITQLKETVGYNFWIDEEGGARFELPNWYTPGNRIQETGAVTSFVPTVDERTNLLSLSVSYTDTPVRSDIVISTADPTIDLKDTITAHLTMENLAPESASLLRGMTKPMMWVNDTFQSQAELNVMAERVAAQILFNQRKASVTCAYNPAIQINDQIQIYERITSEVYVHYVRGVSTEHDLESGRMVMTLDTHWLGPGGDFLINSWNLSG